jgi:Ca-activated chloride channel family protein
VPQLDTRSLQRLAAAGGGRYAALTSSDRDLDALFPAPAALPLDVALDEAAGEQYEADVWRDRGLVLAIVLLPLLALCFRRGWIAVWLLVVLAPVPRAHALEWQDLWQRPDQRGIEALENAQAARAAELFESPEWRGAAQYRAGQFEASAASLANVDSTAGHYNRGNALAKAGEIPAAIAAYDRALELDPDHEDARYNRELLEQFLQDNPQQQQEQGQGEQTEANADQAQGESGEQQEGGEAADQQSQQGEQGDSGESQAAEGASDQPEEPNDGQPQDEESEQQANAGDEASDEAAADAPGPQDVEQWASEQAAEQWLRRVPQDPGGLLRRKFLYQYQRFGVDQNGNRLAGGAAAEQRPW